MPKIRVAPYKPHPDDPPALLVECPACKAPVGSWCSAGYGDVHAERVRRERRGRSSRGRRRGR